MEAGHENFSFISFFSFFVSIQDRAGSIVKNHALRGQFLPSILRRYFGEPAYGMGAHADALPPSRLAGGVAPTTPEKPSKAAGKIQQPQSSICWTAHLPVSAGNCVRSAKLKTKIHIGRAMIMDR